MNIIINEWASLTDAIATAPFVSFLILMGIPVARLPLPGFLIDPALLLTIPLRPQDECLPPGGVIVAFSLVIWTVAISAIVEIGR